jgi:hypothetical protein
MVNISTTVRGHYDNEVYLWAIVIRRFCDSDLGLLSYYLGLQVKQKPGEIEICQSAYAQKIVEMVG